MKQALSGRGAWKKIGKKGLSKDEKTPSRYFKRDKLTGKYFIYQNSTFIPAERTDCLGLEATAVWSKDHAESRLNDHFFGRENVWAKSLSA